MVWISFVEGASSEDLFEVATEIVTFRFGLRGASYEGEEGFWGDWGEEIEEVD